MRPGSGFRISPNWLKIWKMTMMSQLSKNSSNLFDLAVFILSSLVTGPSFMSISWLELRQFFVYKGLTRNLEIVNTPVWALSNTWRLGQFRAFISIYNQAFIFGPANGKFRQRFFICREKVHRRSKMSCFYINLDWSEWLIEAMVLPVKWFCWEYS